MATGKMSFNYYQNGKYGTMPNTQQKDMEVTQDMHLKMSKKIAQLTKVIYALNTKNDENETVLQALREQHEEEKQKLMVELQAKIKGFQSKLEGESDHRKEIGVLQTRISEYEQHQGDVEARLARLKEEAQAKEQALTDSHNRQIQQLTQDVLRAKREFEEHLQGFEAWKLETEARHAKTVEEQTAKHAKELEELRGFQHNQDSDWLTRCAQLEEKQAAERSALEQQLTAAREEKARQEEDYTQKLDKAQAFYEKELEALRQSQSSSFDDQLSLLRKEQERLKADFSAQEGELRHQIDRLVRQLADTEDLAESQKQELERLRAELGSRDSNAESVSQMLQAAKDETIAAKERLRELETELAASKERCSDQAADLLKKSGLIGELEAIKLQKTSQVEDLSKKLEALQTQLAKLMAERDGLMSNQRTLSSDQQLKLTSLTQTIEDLTVEKETSRQKYERELEALRKLMEERVGEVTTTLETRIANAEQRHKEERDSDRKAAAEVLVSTKEDLQSQFSEERRKLQAERDAIQAEFERVKAELLSKCKHAEDEVARLDKMVRESEQGLGSASSHIQGLKDAAAALKAELDKTRSDLKAAKMHSANLQAELDKLKMLHESKSAEWQMELKTRLEKLAAELDAKWTDTMRSECSKLRSELTQQKNDEKRAALERLAKLKEEAFAAERVSFENRLTQLNRQLADLRAKLDQAHTSSNEDAERLRREVEAEKARLAGDAETAAQEHRMKLQEMEDAHRRALQKVIDDKDQERRAGEKELKDGHHETTKGTMAAHKLALTTAEEVAEQKLKMELREAEDRFNTQQENLKTELQQKLEVELENLQQSHGSELRAARMELERAVEISKQKERDFGMRIEELQEEISARETHIVKLKEELRRLQTSIATLNKALAAKDGETQKVQKEYIEKLRQVEERLKGDHQRALENLAADQARDSQEMVQQFNAAQEMLKDRISQLQIMLAEAEERYNARDSRPEDLELIQQLRDEVQEREMRVKQLIDEKKFYQMELVNRETNFNKVFNAAPNVGVLNPRQVKPKKGDKGGSGKSGGSGGSRHLAPLPNSPLHDDPLNPSKPLPQPPGVFAKKFVK